MLTVLFLLLFYAVVMAGILREFGLWGSAIPLPWDGAEKSASKKVLWDRRLLEKHSRDTFARRNHRFLERRAELSALQRANASRKSISIAERNLEICKAMATDAKAEWQQDVEAVEALESFLAQSGWKAVDASGSSEDKVYRHAPESFDADWPERSDKSENPGSDSPEGGEITNADSTELASSEAPDTARSTSTASRDGE